MSQETLMKAVANRIEIKEEEVQGELKEIYIHFKGRIANNLNPFSLESHLSYY